MVLPRRDFRIGGVLGCDAFGGGVAQAIARERFLVLPGRGEHVTDLDLRKRERPQPTEVAGLALEQGLRERLRGAIACERGLELALQAVDIADFLLCKEET